jgi:excisionase family DNA binding protein
MTHLVISHIQGLTTSCNLMSQRLSNNMIGDRTENDPTRRYTDPHTTRMHDKGQSMPYRKPVKRSLTTDYTCDELARKLNKSPSTIRQKVSRGEIPSYKEGSSRRIPADYVEQLLAQAGNAGLAAAVDRVVAQWPKLTDTQLDRIAALLRAGGRATTAKRKQAS